MNRQRRQRRPSTLATQMATRNDNRHTEVPSENIPYSGNFGTRMVSTGSTLLDLAISGHKIRGGGIPPGILVEIFGPSSIGKTVLATEIAGNVQRYGGAVRFEDPEARLNKVFARLFGLNFDNMEYGTPDTVTELFKATRAWNPVNPQAINGIFADSLAALSTDLEMSKEGDKMGMRRAKEFSEEIRRTCRLLVQKNYLMVCTNQVRVNMDGGFGAQKYKTPGGEAVGFYASLRLKGKILHKIKRELKFKGNDIKRYTGVQTEFEVFKSSVDRPFGTAPVTILFDYGIDDIGENLLFIKKYTNATTFAVNDTTLGTGKLAAIQKVEEFNLEMILREQVINLWHDIEEKFESPRKPKVRW